LLPAFLSFYLGADEQRLPRAGTRILQGLFVGALVTVGFVGLFALVSLPVSFGVALVASAVPWVGLLTGALLALAGLVVISGRRLPMPLHLQLPVRRERRLGAMLLFGVGYGAASLGCTLPLFLTLVGASAGGSKITVFLAYALGTAVVLMALSVVVALAREGVVRGVRSLLPYMHWITRRLLFLLLGTPAVGRQRDRRRRPDRQLRRPLLRRRRTLCARTRSRTRRGSRRSRRARTAQRTCPLAAECDPEGVGARMIRLSVLAPTVLVLVTIGCSCGCAGTNGNAAGPDRQPAANNASSSPQLTDLRDIGQLRTLFNTASGEPRLIILVSPI
jgi:cytochrome c-type biogenesis protein